MLNCNLICIYLSDEPNYYGNLIDFTMKLTCKNFLILGGMFLISCVPISKFNEIQKKYDDCSANNSKQLEDNEKLQVSSTECNEHLESCTKDRDSLIKDTVRLHDRLVDMQRSNNILEDSCRDLLTMNANILSNSKITTSTLSAQLSRVQLDLQKREDQLKIAESSLDDKKIKLEMLSQELDKRTQRMKELESILNRKDSAVAALKSKVSSALLGFENNGLSVHIKDGKVYVSLEEKLLFRSGSATVDQRGISALKKLALVLEQNTDINIMIEGHTDDVPIIRMVKSKITGI